MIHKGIKAGKSAITMMAMDERRKDQLASLFRSEFGSVLYVKGAAHKSIDEIAVQLAAGPEEFRQMAGALVARMDKDLTYASPAELEALFYEMMGLKGAGGMDEATLRVAEAVRKQVHETFEPLGKELSGISERIAQRKESVKKVPGIISDVITREKADDPDIAGKVARALLKNGITSLTVVNEAMGKGTSWEFLYFDILNGKGEFGGEKKPGLNDVFHSELELWKKEHPAPTAAPVKEKIVSAVPQARAADAGANIVKEMFGSLATPEHPKPEATTPQPAAPQSKPAAEQPAHAAMPPAQPAAPEPAPKPEAAAPKPVAQNPEAAAGPLAYAAPQIFSTRPAQPEKEKSPGERIIEAMQAAEDKKNALVASNDPNKKREIRHLDEAMASLAKALEALGEETPAEKPKIPDTSALQKPAAHKRHVPDSFLTWVEGAGKAKPTAKPAAHPAAHPKKAAPTS